MRYRWKPNTSQKREYIEKMKEKENLNTFTTNNAIRNGCFLKFYSISNSNSFNYIVDRDVRAVDLNLLKNENWQDILKKEIDNVEKEKKIKNLLLLFSEYNITKNKAIKIAKEYALLTGVRLYDIERGTFTLMSALDCVEEIKVTVSYELRVFYGELDDFKTFSFPVELLVIDNWKEKLKEYIDSKKKY
jgi:hypothetical protein